MRVEVNKIILGMLMLAGLIIQPRDVLANESEELEEIYNRSETVERVLVEDVVRGMTIKEVESFVTKEKERETLDDKGLEHIEGLLQERKEEVNNMLMKLNKEEYNENIEKYTQEQKFLEEKDKEGLLSEEEVLLLGKIEDEEYHWTLNKLIIVASSAVVVVLGVLVAGTIILKY